jgi:hypothetical protein
MTSNAAKGDLDGEHESVRIGGELGTEMSS